MSFIFNSIQKAGILGHRGFLMAFALSSCYVQRTLPSKLSDPYSEISINARIFFFSLTWCWNSTIFYLPMMELSDIIDGPDLLKIKYKIYFSFLATTYSTLQSTLQCVFLCCQCTKNLLIWFCWDKVSFCSPDYFGVSYIDKTGLELIEILLSLPQKSRLRFF